MAQNKEFEIPEIFKGAIDYKDDPGAFELAQKTFNEEGLYCAIASFASEWYNGTGKPAKVLDLCSSTGLCALRVARAVPSISVQSVTLVDMDQSVLTIGRKYFDGICHCEVFCDDAVTFQKGGPYDLILMNSAYHHIENDRKSDFMKNAASLLADGGAILVGEHFLPPYNTPDEYRESVVVFYTRLIEELERRGEPAGVVNVLRKAGLYCWEGNYEHKVSWNVFMSNLAHIDIEIKDHKFIWKLGKILYLTSSAAIKLEKSNPEIYYKTYHDALCIFQKVSSKDPSISKAGEILLDIGIDAKECEKIFWVTPEIRISKSMDEYPLPLRSRPISILTENTEKVEKFHEKFYKDPSSWDEETKNWVTLTAIMDHWKNDPKYQNNHPTCFALLFDSSELNAFISCEEYKLGKLVVIYAKSDNCFELLHSSSRDPINVDDCYGNGQKTLKYVIEDFRKFDQQNLCAYVGYHNPGGLSDVRFWAAFGKGIKKQCIFQVKNFIAHINACYSNQIHDSVLESIDLKTFWDVTKDIDPHTKNAQAQSKLLKHFRHFIGWTKDDGPFGLEEKDILNCLKTMSGYVFLNEKGVYNNTISLLGIFFIFLGAAAGKKFNIYNKCRVNIDDKSIIRHKSPLPNQKKDTGKDTILALYEMFLTLITHKDDNDKLLVSEARLNQDRMEVEIILNPQKSNTEDRSPLHLTLGHRLMNLSKIESDENQKFGDTTKSIIEFWLRSNVRDSFDLSKKTPFFPHKRAFGFICTGQQMILNFSPHKED